MRQHQYIHAFTFNVTQEHLDDIDNFKKIFFILLNRYRIKELSRSLFINRIKHIQFLYSGDEFVRNCVPVYVRYSIVKVPRFLAKHKLKKYKNVSA